jgi:hypothetical protein
MKHAGVARTERRLFLRSGETMKMSFMTKMPGVPDTDDVKDGMAYFAATGPFGATCGTCTHRSYWRDGKTKFNARTNQIEEKRVLHGGCRMFLKLSGKHGPRVEKKWCACKYYSEKS